MEKFVCLKCGNCCRTLIGSEQDKLDLTPPCFFVANGVSPIIILNRPTLNIKNREKDLFPLGSVVPNLAVFDLMSNRTIILNYTLNTTVCPLLNADNTCSIYEKRPIACRAFPIPYQRIESEGIPSNSYGLCKAEIHLEDLNKMFGFEKVDGSHMKINSRTLNRNLFDRYGDTVIYQNITDALTKMSTEIMANLIKEKKIKLATSSYKFEFLKRRMSNTDKIDFSDFLLELGLGHLEEYAFSDETIVNLKKEFQSLEPS